MSQQKAISPIIATIIILLVTIAIAGAGYSYISTYWAGLVGKEIQVVSSFCTGDNQGKVMVKNIGTNPVRTGEIAVINPNTGEDLTKDVAWSSSVTGHVDDPGLVLELMFEEGSGATAKDTSGNGNDGTLYGDTSWVEGRVGVALSFDGTGDYVITISSTALDPYPYTFSAWVKLSQYNPDGNTGAVILANYAGGTDSIFYISNGGRASIRPHPGIDLGGSRIIPLNQWTHIAATLEGTTLKVYVNGEEDGSISSSGYSGGESKPFTIAKASWYNGNYLNGIIDEVRVYGRALSENEIGSLAGNFQVQPGETATLTHACSGRCRYNLILGWGAKEAMLEC